MCFLLSLLLLGPRFGIIIWWIVQPSRWDAAFGSVIWPILGLFVAPWTTLMFVAVAPFGNVEDWDWIWLGLAFMGDMLSLTSNAYTNRNRIPGYPPGYA